MPSIIIIYSTIYSNSLSITIATLIVRRLRLRGETSSLALYYIVRLGGL